MEIDIGVLPEAAVSGAVVYQTEYASWLVFNAMKRDANGQLEDAGRAVVELVRCSVSKFGYPNDEALPGHPLYKNGLDGGGYGVYEVLNPTWAKEVTKQNRVCFPKKPDSKQRHFLFTFHDSTFECLADDLRVTIRQEPFRAIIEELTGRILTK